jgi:hypothetical protein
VEKNTVHIDFEAAMFPRRAVEGFMPHADTQQRIIEEWFRLPESRRRHATDAVAFAFRVLQDHPELMRELTDAGHEVIMSWLAPYLGEMKRIADSG